MKITDFHTEDDYEYMAECSTLQLNGFPSQILVEGFLPSNPSLTRVFTRSDIVRAGDGDTMYAIYHAEPSPMYNQGGARLTVFND